MRCTRGIFYCILNEKLTIVNPLCVLGEIIMKRTVKYMSMLLTASMLVPLGACSDKSLELIPGLASEVCVNTKELDYRGLSGASRYEDEALEEIFDLIGEDDAKKAVAATLEYEVNADSLQQADKLGYTIDVSFTYTDYRAVLEDESIVSVEDFEEAVEASDDLIREDLTLTFYNDGSDILLMNLADLEKLFPYADEEIEFHEEVVETEPSVAETTSSDDAAVDPADDAEDGGVIELNSNEAAHLEEGDTFSIPGTDLLYTVPEGASVTNRSLRNQVDVDVWNTVYEDTDFYMFYIMTAGFGGYDPYSAETLMDRYVAEAIGDGEDDYGWFCRNSDIEVEIGGTTYNTRWFTHTSDSIYHAEIYIMVIGNEDVCYLLVFAGTDEAYFDIVLEGFSVAE